MSYATPDDLRTLGLPPDALEELDNPAIQAQLTADAGVMDVYLSSQHTLPLAAPYPEALKRINVCLATYHILCRRGYNPEGPDRLYQDNYRDCMEMLKAISSGELSVPGIVDDTPDVNESAPLVTTMRNRGWQASFGDERA